MKKSLKVKGTDKCVLEMLKLAKKYPEETGRALFIEGLGIQKASVEITPVDTGRLRASAYTAPPEEKNSGPQVRVGYGAAYGVYVHERTELHHKVGQAKFLETAANAARSGFAARVADYVKKAVG